MAIQQTPQADLFKQQLRDSLQRETANSRAVKVDPARQRIHLRRSGRDGLFCRERPGQTAHALHRR